MTTRKLDNGKSLDMYKASRRPPLLGSAIRGRQAQDDSFESSNSDSNSDIDSNTDDDDEEESTGSTTEDDDIDDDEAEEVKTKPKVLSKPILRILIIGESCSGKSSLVVHILNRVCPKKKRVFILNHKSSDTEKIPSTWKQITWPEVLGLRK